MATWDSEAFYSLELKPLLSTGKLVLLLVVRCHLLHAYCASGVVITPHSQENTTIQYAFVCLLTPQDQSRSSQYTSSKYLKWDDVKCVHWLPGVSRLWTNVPVQCLGLQFCVWSELTHASPPGVDWHVSYFCLDRIPCKILFLLMYFSKSDWP